MQTGFIVQVFDICTDLGGADVAPLCPKAVIYPRKMRWSVNSKRWRTNEFEGRIFSGERTGVVLKESDWECISDVLSKHAFDILANRKAVVADRGQIGRA